MVLEDNGSTVLIGCQITDENNDDIARLIVCASAFLLKGFEIQLFITYKDKISISLARNKEVNIEST